MNPAIEDLADQLIAARFRQEPLEAALLGLPARRGELADLSSSAQADLMATYSSLASAAEALYEAARVDELDHDETDVLTLDLIRMTAETTALSLSVPLLEFTATDIFVAPLAGVLAALPMLALDSPERRDDQLARLAALPVFLEQSAQRLRDGVDAGRTPQERGVRAAMAQIDAITGDPLLGALRSDPDGAPDEFAAAQGHVLDEVVRPALLRYREVLENQVLPSGRADEKPGLCWLPGGEDMYQRCVRYSTSTEHTAEDLHSTGLAIIERLNEEFAALGSELWNTTDVAEIHERLRTDPALRYESGDEIVTTAIEAVRRAEHAAPEWFGLIPTTACAVEPIPEALAEGSPPAYYFTGALDGSRVGTYFINTTKPEQRFRHLAEAVAFHEAVPGHHFQLTIAQQLEGSHVVHSVFADVATAEGWGLYAERLADEMGLYTSAVARLGMVSTDAWRAARLVVDTGLHALGWSRQDAIDWMGAHVPMSSLEIHSEVDRYISVPGQALAYMVGRLALEAHRRDAAERLGERFNIRAFHDLILRSGPVPLPALASAVERWISSQTNASN
ncbi:MAG TPA: DUF885 domain-containing protein [Acidimicrobiales bacterium]|nr:DUF885 domain-containing protein [Acidimicrobiales bacterium]